MILLLDHEDSFVFTLARYVRELGASPTVISARDATVASIRQHGADRIILSPGPRHPNDCPVTLELIRKLGPDVPILGVCLGHQCIAQAYGAAVEPTANFRHGRTSMIRHDGGGIFTGIPSPFTGARYHSLAVRSHDLPDEMVVTAWADDGEIMGIRHCTHPTVGVQFHPESVLTEWGYLLLANFLGVALRDPHPASDMMLDSTGVIVR